MQKGNFEGRFLSKLSKIDKQEIENFLSNLVREKHFLEIVFNAMLDGIIVLRPSLEVVYANNQALDLLRINPKRKIIGERVAALVDIPEFRELVARFALHPERTVTTEIELAGALERALSVAAIPLEADNESVTGNSVLIIHDITEARRNAEERRRADRAMTLATLTAGLAHEIKNPLNSLQIHAQLLQKGLRDLGERGRKVDKARMTQSGDIILDEIRRLSDVVDTFLTAVRPTRPLFERGNINRLVDRVAETIRPEAEARGIRLKVGLDHEIPPTSFDPNQMKQALLNLVKNSIEALAPSKEDSSDETVASGAPGVPDLFDGPDSSRRALIEIRTELAEKECRIHVLDNGPGISEEHLRKIHEPYFTTKFSGTGLGLAIVSRIIEEHQGRMDFISKPGLGTVVTLSFPVDARPVRLLGG